MNKHSTRRADRQLVAGLALLAGGLCAMTAQSQPVPVVVDSLGQQTLLPNTIQPPQVRDTSDGRPYELGVKFIPSRNGVVTAIR